VWRPPHLSMNWYPVPRVSSSPRPNSTAIPLLDENLSVGIPRGVCSSVHFPPLNAWLSSFGKSGRIVPDVRTIPSFPYTCPCSFFGSIAKLFPPLTHHVAIFFLFSLFTHPSSSHPLVPVTRILFFHAFYPLFYHIRPNPSEFRHD